MCNEKNQKTHEKITIAVTAKFISSVNPYLPRMFLTTVLRGVPKFTCPWGSSEDPKFTCPIFLTDNSCAISFLICCKKIILV